MGASPAQQTLGASGAPPAQPRRFGAVEVAREAAAPARRQWRGGGGGRTESSAIARRPRARWGRERVRRAPARRAAWRGGGEGRCEVSGAAGGAVGGAGELCGVGRCRGGRGGGGWV